MSADFIMGVIVGVVGLCLVVLMADPDTLRTATERGFYTQDNQLYVVRKAQPNELPAT